MSKQLIETNHDFSCEVRRFCGTKAIDLVVSIKHLLPRRA